MAKRAQPDPRITDKWMGKLAVTADRLDVARKIVAALEAQRDEDVRGAFSEGVVVGALKPATGLSGSRIYQIKFALRDAGAEALAELLAARLSDEELLELVQGLESMLAAQDAPLWESRAV